MRFHVVVVVFSLGFFAHANHPDHIKAEGTALFKSGTSLQSTKVDLYVPKKGQGKVILEFQGKEVESDSFRSAEVLGRKVFNVRFTDAPGTAKGTETLLTGTYLRGDNQAVYFGDFYLKAAGATSKWGHGGGFYFSTK